jgi:hypothetical protein
MSLNNPAIVVGIDAIDKSKEILANVDATIDRTASNVENAGDQRTC